MKVSEAREKLTSARPKFGDPDQIEAVWTIEKRGALSDAQMKRWGTRFRRLRKLVKDALNDRVIICNCCGRTPWAVAASSPCISNLIDLYRLNGCPHKWFAAWVREWYKAQAKPVHMRVIDHEDDHRSEWRRSRDRGGLPPQG